MTTNIDIISDLHFDYWVKSSACTKSRMEHFINHILPETPSDILIIAGDIGHYNTQNIMGLQILKDTYKYICWTHGNHDLLLITKSSLKKYHKDSFKRLSKMVELSNELENVYYLDGNVIDIDGITIGGASGWYDFQYGIQVHYSSIEQMHMMWSNGMIDARKIFPVLFDTLKYADEQYKKLDTVVNSSPDIIVSHVGPDWGKIHPRFNDPSTGLFYFDGKELLSKLDENTTWVYGHTHDRIEYQHHMGCHMMCNPMGYPWECRNPIKTITIEN